MLFHIILFIYPVIVLPATCVWAKTWASSYQSSFAFTEDNMVGFLQQQNNTARFYSDLMGKLERMNSTLGYLLLYLDNMQGRLEDRLHIIQRYLGWAGIEYATDIKKQWNLGIELIFFVFSP